MNGTWYAKIVGPSGAVRPGGTGPGEFTDLIPCAAVTWEKPSYKTGRYSVTAPAVLTIAPGVWTPQLAVQLRQMAVTGVRLREVTLYRYVPQPGHANVAFGHASQPSGPPKLNCTIKLDQALISNVEIVRDVFAGGAQVTIDYGIKHVVYAG